jgi:hypothetical protein
LTSRIDKEFIVKLYVIDKTTMPKLRLDGTPEGRKKDLAVIMENCEITNSESEISAEPQGPNSDSNDDIPIGESA